MSTHQGTSPAKTLPESGQGPINGNWPQLRALACLLARQAARQVGLADADQQAAALDPASRILSVDEPETKT